MDNLQNKNIANILIVDDIPANLKMLGDILKGFGYKVRPVPNGAMALQVAEKEKPDLIMLDIMMPDMDGYEVCKRLKVNENLKEIPIIFISALNDTNDIVKALNSGAVDYITKPFKPEEVKARVSTHIKIVQQNNELKKLNANKDRFISIIAHDLKNPFNTILGFSELLVNNIHKYDIDKIEKFAKNINQAAQNAFKLLEDLLLWAKAQSNILFNPVNLNLTDICKDIVQNLKYTYNNKNISINCLITQDLFVFADLNMLNTIIRNLISNAIKFTNNGGEINIYTEQNQTNITIIVQDNGVGISSETLPKLFDISQKRSTLGTENEKGSGLGLALCREFVEKHGGKIWAESEIEKGSKFKFTIPTTNN